MIADSRERAEPVKLVQAGGKLRHHHVLYASFWHLPGARIGHGDGQLRYHDGSQFTEPVSVFVKWSYDRNRCKQLKREAKIYEAMEKLERKQVPYFFGYYTDAEESFGISIFEHCIDRTKSVHTQPEIMYVKGS